MRILACVALLMLIATSASPQFHTPDPPKPDVIELRIQSLEKEVERLSRLNEKDEGVIKNLVEWQKLQQRKQAESEYNENYPNDKESRT
jgi:hypothetical protein